MAGPSSASGIPAASRAAAGANTSRPWKVRETGCSMMSGFVIATASTTPPQASAAGISRPLSGPTKWRPSRAAKRDRPPLRADAGIDDGQVHADRQVLDRPGEHARALPDRLRLDAVGDVDHARVGADQVDHAVADAGEVVRRPEVGQEGDERRVLRGRHALDSSRPASALDRRDQPVDVCGSASATGSTPCSRSVGARDRADRGRPQAVEAAVAERGGEARDGRRRRERDQVGRPHRLGVDRLGHRAVEVDDVDAARRARAARRGARRARPRRSRPAPAGRRRRRAPRAATRTRPRPAPRRATMPRARSACAVAGPIAATVHAVQRADVAGQEQLDAVCARHARRCRSAPRSGAVERQAARSGSPAPARPRPPAPRAGRRGRSPGRGRASPATRRPCSGRRSNQSSCSCSAATAPTSVIAGGAHAGRGLRRCPASGATTVRWPGRVPSRDHRGRRVGRPCRARSGARRFAPARRRPSGTRACPASRRATPSRGRSPAWPDPRGRSRTSPGPPCRAASPGCRRRRARRRPTRCPAPPRRRCPAAASASASSPPRPKMNGSPPFSRTTVSWRAAELDQPRVDRLLRHRVLAGPLAGVDALRALRVRARRCGGRPAGRTRARRQPRSARARGR